MLFRSSCTKFAIMKIEKHVQKFICKRGLMTKEAGILVGLSGGADSVALLRMLVRLDYRC